MTMGLFKSRPDHRAGARSFAAFKKVWIGQPFSECMTSGTKVWESEYQDTLKKCRSGPPIDVLNNAIDVTMWLIIKGGQERARSTVEQSSLPEDEAQKFAGTFATLGALSHVVFAYVPAAAASLDVDPDQVCYDTVEAIRQSLANRNTEMHPAYADASNIVLGAFLEELFEG